MDDLLREFLTETFESLDTVDNQLVRFEQEPNNAKILDNVFRLVHTIKGTCGFLGLPRLEALAHAAETLMGKFRDGMPVTGEAVTLILTTIDRIKDILGGLEATQAEPEGEDRDLIGEHRLRREIISTQVCNQMANLSGISFDHRVGEETGVGVVDILRAWVAARDILGLVDSWEQVDRLTGLVKPDVQIDLFLELRSMAERVTLWLLRRDFRVLERYKYLLGLGSIALVAPLVVVALAVPAPRGALRPSPTADELLRAADRLLRPPVSETALLRECRPWVESFQLGAQAIARPGEPSQGSRPGAGALLTNAMASMLS